LDGWVTVIEFELQPPLAYFYCSPDTPTAGEPVHFYAYSSYDPDGYIVSYKWDFGDGSSGSGVTAAHIYSAGGTYTAALTVTDNNGLNSTKAIDITVLWTTISVQAEVGSIHFRGEMAEFYILVSSLGNPIDVTINATLYFSGTVYADLSTSAEHVSLGLYRIAYTIPVNAQPGTYVLVVNANYLTLNGISLESFLLSPTLTGWNAQLTSINGTVATIKTDLGLVKVDINSINAKLTAFNVTVATIQTDIGEITTDIANIQLKIASINGTTATIQTTLGSFSGQITSIEGNIATIKTDMGTVKTNLPEGLMGAQSADATPLYIIMATVLLVSIGTMLLTFFRRKKP
jgi:PKD repeat protein